MRDIAKLAGVSKSTVSRALADNPLVSRKTRELIQSLARKHRYRIDQRARNFRLRDSLTMAVVMPGSPEDGWRLTDPFIFELLRAISIATDERGHQLLLTRVTPQKPDWIAELIESGTADGLLLLGQDSAHRQISQLARRHRAISVWGAQIDKHQNYFTVGTDNRLGGRLATRHLLDMGCRRILFLGSRAAPELQQRYEGYIEAHQEAGVEARPDLCVHGHHNGEDPGTGVHDLINAKSGFDGIFAGSDMLALSVIQTLIEAGLRVPTDVAVVGYDDIPLARGCRPPISSIRQNCIAGGKALVDGLLTMMEGGAPKCVIMEPELIVRQSSIRNKELDGRVPASTRPGQWRGVQMPG